MVKERTWITAIAILFGWAMAFVPAVSGALLHLEDFDPDAAGWGDRDAGDMAVNHDAGNEWMTGSFAATILPQADAFRIDTVGDTGGNFTGDYVTPGITQISFDLQAVNALPSDLFIRIIDGANIFSYQFNPINLGSWTTYTVDLAWSFGWLGLDEAAFNTALTSVDAVEIQITRNGSGIQSYNLDNVETLDTDIGDPGGPSAVPEPGTLALFGLGVLSLVLRRRFYPRA